MLFVVSVSKIVPVVSGRTIVVLVVILSVDVCLLVVVDSSQVISAEKMIKPGKQISGSLLLV